jgi:hypothetical protein
MTKQRLDTRWVATIKTQDAVTIHLEGSREELQATYQLLLAHFGPALADTWLLVEVPVTWACDGRDGCQVVD